MKASVPFGRACEPFREMSVKMQARGVREPMRGGPGTSATQQSRRQGLTPLSLPGVHALWVHSEMVR